ncbi:ABC transporter permease [bacterium]|nr:ABC transporter permease [bacterium]
MNRHLFRYFWYFVRRDWMIETSYKFSFVFQFAGIFLQVMLFYFFALFIGDGAARFLQSYGGNYFAFVLIGIAYQGYFSVALSGFSSKLRRDQMLGTLEMMLMSPLSGQRILALSASYDLVFTSLRIFLYLLVGGLFFGLSFGEANSVTCLVILVLTVSSFSGLGILSAAFIMVIKKGDPVVWLFSMLNTLFGGVYFTIEVFPPMLQKLALCLPITHSLHAFRKGLMFGSSLDELWFEVIFLLIFSFVTLPLGLWAFSFAIRRAKQSGSLGQH